MRISVTIGKSEPVVFNGTILYEGAGELGDLTLCQEIKIRGRVEGVENSDKTITFRTPFCSWEVLDEGDDYFELLAHAEGW